MLPDLKHHWTPEQKLLALTIYRKTVIEANYTEEEFRSLVIGMTLAGPLGRACPTWRVTSLQKCLAAGPPIETPSRAGDVFTEKELSELQSILDFGEKR